MEVLMGIFLKACVAVLVGAVCLIGLLLYSKKKDREEAQNGAAAGAGDKNTAAGSPEGTNENQAGSGQTICNGDCSKCFSHCNSADIKKKQEP